MTLTRFLLDFARPFALQKLETITGQQQLGRTTTPWLTGVNCDFLATAEQHYNPKLLDMGEPLLLLTKLSAREVTPSLSGAPVTDVSHFEIAQDTHRVFAFSPQPLNLRRSTASDSQYRKFSTNWGSSQLNWIVSDIIVL